MKKNISNILIIVGIVVVVAIMILLFAFTGNKDESKENGDSTGNTNSSEYVNYASKYIDEVEKKIESGELKADYSNNIYLFPVGNNSCVSIDKNPDFKYAFVGVVNMGSYYDYYFMSKDKNNKGFNITTKLDIVNHGNDNFTEEIGENEFDKIYNISKNGYITTTEASYVDGLFNLYERTGYSSFFIVNKECKSDNFELIIPIE